MISHLLEIIFKLQHSDSFETAGGAPRDTPWTRFMGFYTCCTCWLQDCHIFLEGRKF